MKNVPFIYKKTYNRVMKKIHLLPNVITAFGLSCGLFVIFRMALLPVGGINEQVLTSIAGIMLLAALADLLDGAVARAMKAESEFGGLFDSLADGITFGVAPSVVVLKSLSIVQGAELWFVTTAAAMIYSVCGVLRLVRFGVQATNVRDNAELKVLSNKNFTGLPIPGAAAAVISGVLLLFSSELEWFVHFSDYTRAWILIVMMILLGYLMVSRWKFPSLKNLHVRVASFQIVFLTVIGAVFFFYGIIHFFPIVFFGFSWMYVGVSLVLSIIRVISGRNSKTLEEFEPDPDELEE